MVIRIEQASRYRRSRVPLAFGWIVSGLITASGLAAEPSKTEIDFNRDVRPILSDKCFQCHGPDSNTREAGLRLDSFASATEDRGDSTALVPGSLDQSELIRRIDDTDDPMPPADSNRSLTADEIQTLRRWVQSGGDYAKHWSFVSPVKPPVPVVATAIKNPIDAFVAHRHASQGLSFSDEATPATLIRRVSLDLTGFPPTPAQVDEFVLDYKSRGEVAYADLINRLISSPAYGETMALPWLDAARFADTDGYQYDGPRFQWRWRDWVIDAYNRNLPFDQFTIEQLAGDLLPGATREQQIATGFNRNHRYNSEAGIVVEEFLLENAVDRVDTTATLWMGLTMGCARCHDHKFDPISQADYYQLIAFFNSVPEAGRALKPANSEPLILAPTPLQQERLDELRRQVDSARNAVANVSSNRGESSATGSLTNHEPLIDRHLTQYFSLEQLPTENIEVAGHAVCEENALVLDGRSSVKLAKLGKTPKLAANQSFTIGFWIRPADSSIQSDQPQIILSRQNTGSTRPGVEIALVENGHVQFDLISRWLAGVGRVTSKQPLPADQWTHLTVTNDGSQSARGQKLYFNGQLISTEVGYNTNSNPGGVGPDRPLMIAGGQRDDADSFAGAIKAIQIHDAELWPEEIIVLGSQLGSDERTKFSLTKSSPAYRTYIAARERYEKYKSTLPTVMVMRELPEPKPTFVRVRGVYNSLGQRVNREVPAALPPLSDDLPRNRLGLAKWLVSPKHPLTARVAVNRYWQKYFGVGLVRTPEDFGTQGTPPSHPELLDWLATTFVDSNWDIAAMQRLIVTSRTYRQRSTVTPESLEKDPANTWLARGARMRLNAHAIRDQALFVSGLLTQRIGGPSVSPYQPPGLWAEMSMGMKYKPSRGEDLFRRSLYTIWKRTVAPPTMSVFDAADRESCSVGRTQTNTPLQALTLLNETDFVESARHLAVRMIHAPDPIGFGFRSVTSRSPTDRERKALQDALGQYRHQFSVDPKSATDLTQMGQSPAIEQIDAADLAAHTAIANVLLNLDETITRQ